jgi:hypothetical protein
MYFYFLQDWLQKESPRFRLLKKTARIRLLGLFIVLVLIVEWLDSVMPVAGSCWTTRCRG